LIKCLFKYKAFIFFSGDSLLKDFKDFKLYRRFNKKTMMLFFGCDLQQPELTFRNDIPISACHNCTQQYKDFVGCVPEKKILRTRKIEKAADIIVSHLAFSDVLERKYLKITQPINIEEFPVDIPEIHNKIPVILHAPSNFGYKGTQFLIEAVDKLKNEFKFEFRLVHNVPINELYNEITNADIVVDQLIQGWFGMLPLEAMMLKKPVICYIRDDVLAQMPADFPVINANPSTVYSVLKELLQNRSNWKEIGEAGRLYVEKYHNAKEIAETYAQLLL
jgi:glycosyltransferase involved in cell wall biosynthesis